MTIKTNVVIGSISIPRGSAVNILATYSIAHFAGAVFKGSPNYDTTLMYTVLLGYLAEIWLGSAAREQGTDQDDAVSFENQSSIGITKNDLKQLFIDFDAAPLGGFSQGRVRATGDYGYCQFLYADGATDIIHISWQHAKLVPPRPSCSGANLWFREPLSGSYVVVYNSVAAPQVVVDTSNPVSPSTNVMTGIAFGVESSVDNFQSGDIGLFHPPTRDVSGFATCDAPQEAVIDITTAFASGPWPSMLLAYLCESWQDIVQPLHGTAEGGYDVLSGENTLPPTLAYMKSGKLVVTPPTHPSAGLKYRCGMPLYGSWAALYGEYAGPLHSLNLITSNLVPDYRDCTGFWIFLKETCTGTLTTNESANWTEGITNPSGGINLAQGITDGLTWDV